MGFALVSGPPVGTLSAVALSARLEPTAQARRRSRRAKDAHGHEAHIYDEPTSGEFFRKAPPCMADEITECHFWGADEKPLVDNKPGATGFSEIPLLVDEPFVATFF